jgi:hypothetical protein
MAPPIAAVRAVPPAPGFTGNGDAGHRFHIGDIVDPRAGAAEGDDGRFRLGGLAGAGAERETGGRQAETVMKKFPTGFHGER